MVDHAGHLHHPSELHLAPAATHVRRPEGAREVGGRDGKRAQLFGQLGVSSRTLFFDCLKLGVDAIQRFVERFDEVPDGLLTMLEV